MPMSKKIKKGDYCSAQHARIMQLEAKISSLVKTWENSSDTTKEAIRQEGGLLYMLLDMKSTLKHKAYDGDYVTGLAKFEDRGFVE